MKRVSMKQIKADAAAKRAAYLAELIEKDIPIYELAENHGVTAQRMGQLIKKAKEDALRAPK